jgi:predicted nucleic acid-binding protein
MKIKNIVFDTNILIDYLQGRAEAECFLRTCVINYSKIFISIISYIEVLVGISDAEKRKKVSEWLGSFTPIMVCPDVAVQAITLRQMFHLKVPDALIMATAKHCHAALATRDRDFRNIPDVLYPYTL